MTSTPPPERENTAEATNTVGLTREDTTNEGYTGFDPSSGLYYYTNGVDQTMFYDGFNNQWLYWNNEGQFYYPVGKDAATPATATTMAAGTAQTTSSTSTKDSEEKEQSGMLAATKGAASASLGAPSGSNLASYSNQTSASSVGSSSQQQQQQQPRKIPDEDKRPLPFRLTSGVQSERERLIGKSSNNNVKKRIDWGAALDNYSVQGFGGHRGGGLGHFSNPPILPPRFYYPHIVPGSYYDFLNVRPNASVEEIEESVQWWELVGYPRAAEADFDRAERVHRLVMEAALIITNSSLRGQYDQTLPLGGKGKGVSGGGGASNNHHGMLDVSNYVPRVLHFHQNDGSDSIASRSSSRPVSVTSTPSKYQTNGKPTPGGTSSSSTNINNNGDDQLHSHHLTSNGQALLEEDLSQPSITERLFAAVSEGIFGPPRTKPRNKKYAAKGMEWIEDERRKLSSSNGTSNANDGATEVYNGEAAAPNSGFKVTNTTTNQSKHADPASSSSTAAVRPPF